MKIKKLLIGVLVVLLGLGLVSAAYIKDYYKTAPEVKSSILEEDIHTHSHKEHIVYEGENAKIGFIFYPGGKVEYSAYAPLLEGLARDGILCVLPKMPGNLAVLDMHAADECLEEFPNIEHWYIGGHSLGASMAASCLGKHNGKFDGLILLAGYSTSDLSQTDLSCLSIRGDKDQVLNLEKYEKYFSNLPKDTTEFVIAGGNHAGFGCYGNQKGDGQADISSSEQQAITIEKIKEFIRKKTPE